MSGASLSWSGIGPGDTRPRWSIALVVVVALHAGAVAAMLIQHKPVERMAATEAILIDLAPAPPAPEPIPEPEEAQAAPPPPQAEEPPPPPEPPPPEVTPEVVLPAPPPPPTPPPPQRRPPTPRPPRPQAVTSHAAPAEEAAPAPVAAPVNAGTAAAPRAGGGGVASWQGQLMARLQAVKRYPETSRARREEGIVHLTFSMDRAGNVLSARIARPSGFRALDEETLELARRASPLPAPPEEVTGNPLTLTVPVRFSLR